MFRAEKPGQPLDSITVTTRVHGEHATRSQYSATRRALGSLAEKGLLIRVGRRGFWGGRSRYVRAGPRDAYDTRMKAIGKFHARLDVCPQGSGTLHRGHTPELLPEVSDFDAGHRMPMG